MRLSVRVLVWLFGCLLRRRLSGVGLVFKLKATLKTSAVPSRFCKSTTLLISQVAWTSPALHEMRQQDSVAEHLHNPSPYSFHSMIEVSAEAWRASAILYLVTPWQYPPRVGMLFYIFSRLGSIRRGLTCYYLMKPCGLGSIRRGLASAD